MHGCKMEGGSVACIGGLIISGMIHAPCGIHHENEIVRKEGCLVTALVKFNPGIKKREIIGNG